MRYRTRIAIQYITAIIGIMGAILAVAAVGQAIEMQTVDSEAYITIGCLITLIGVLGYKATTEKWTKK